MKIIYAGNLHIEHGAESNILKYLKKTGNEIIPFTYPTYLANYDLLNVLLESEIEDNKPDLIICAKCMGLTSEIIKKFKDKYHIKIVQWIFDNMGIVNGEDRSKWWVPQAKSFDMVFNSEMCMHNEYIKQGINHKSIIQGFDHEIFNKIEPTKEDKIKYNADVVFVGSPYNTWRNDMINILSKQKEFTFRHYSNLFYNELNIALNCSKLAITTNYNDFEDRGWSNRLPEMLGAGCLVLSPNIGSMRDYGFVDRYNVIYYKTQDINDLIDKIKYSLSDEKELNFISNNGNMLANETMRWEMIVNQVLKEVTQ